jgi:uncharacterized protein (TIGR03437 family)
MEGFFFSSVNEVFFPPATALPALTADSVVNAANYGAEVAPGALASLFASDLSYTPTLAQPRLPLPSRWNGTQILINGQPAPLLYVSAGQINFQIPPGTTSPATIAVNRGGSQTAAQEMPLSLSAPGLFSVSGSGQGQGAILHANTSQLANTSRPARPGDFLEIYLTGLNCEAAQSCAQAAPEVTVGGVGATVAFAGSAPGFVGLDQINIRVPSGTPVGDAVAVRVARLGRVSNEVTIAIR